MEITIYTTIMWIVALVISILVTIIFLGGQGKTSRLFALNLIWVITWIINISIFISTKDHYYALILARTSYFLGNIIALSFFYFLFTFPNYKKPKIYSHLLIYTVQILFLYIFIFTDKIINDVYKIESPSNWGWTFGSFSNLFEIIFTTFFIIGIIFLINKYRKENNVINKINIVYMLVTISVGIIPPLITCIILPHFGLFNLNWLGPITQIIWVPVILYSIYKYQQMKIQVIITEIISLTLIIIFFINIFTNISDNIIVRILFFLIFCALVLYLSKNILNENKLKSSLQTLNLTLEDKVKEQTREIRKAYDLEKFARRELEKLNDTKDQFITITQHNIRTPILNIDSNINAAVGILNTESTFLSDIVFENIREKIYNFLNNASESVLRVKSIIDDFLNITSIKSSSQILNLDQIDIYEIIRKAVKELSVNIEKMNIKIIFKNKTENLYIKVDSNKIYEVMIIIIENAIKYNTLGGNIEIECIKDDEIIQIDISNTGVGISKEDKENIFNKVFYRSKKAKITHPVGMGVGLSVAKAIIKAHHGDIEINSEGENKGAKVSIRLPINTSEVF